MTGRKRMKQQPAFVAENVITQFFTAAKIADFGSIPTLVAMVRSWIRWLTTIISTFVEASKKQLINWEEVKN